MFMTCQNDISILEESYGPMLCPLRKGAGKFELHDHRRVFYIECKNCVGSGISRDAIDHLTPGIQTILSADARTAATDKYVMGITYRNGFQREVAPRHRR